MTEPDQSRKSASAKAPAGSHAKPPGIDTLLKVPACHALRERHGHVPLVTALRAATAELRARQPPPALEAVTPLILARAVELLQAQAQSSLRPVFNLSGTVLHTNLGRAPLAAEALAAIHAVAGVATNLEFDLASGRRGDRDTHVEALICRLTGAEAATVVNNNAAAVMAVLAGLARRREVIVSRSELVEIGGSFRVPDVMATAGAKLREVGTTNRVHLRDFESAIGPTTALMMKIHPSNYRIEGFTAAVPESELAALARQHGVPFVNDLGSGTLIDFRSLGLPHEPTVQEALAAGADLVTFSGDKLLGGPQAGFIAGRADLVRRIKKHPIVRALRVDKLILDNRGSEARGKAFEQATFRQLGTAEMEDQLDGVNYLKSLKFVDATRLGVHGWSFGGFMTTSLMTRQPDVFKVAVAGGPVIDWSYYEVMYTERYMDTPQSNKAGYEANNLLNYADKLKGKLMLIHGTADDVVVWQHSLQFIKKAIEKNVQLDYFAYPGHLHNVTGKDRVHLMQKISNYFFDYL